MKSQYPAAAQALLDWIKDKNLRPGTALPSGQKLAAQFGTTPSIMLRACQILVSGGFVHRLGNKMAVGSRGRHFPSVLGTIHILSYFPGFIAAAGRFLDAQGIKNRLVGLSWMRHPNPEVPLRKALAGNPAGLILALGTANLEGTSSLFAAPPIPVVLCVDGQDDSPYSTLQTDLMAGVEKVVQHLHQLGHRHIAHVSCGRQAVDRKMGEAFSAACLKLNLKRSASLVWQARVPDDSVLRETIRSGRKRHPEVTAIFGDDRAALVALKLFSVPRELSVVGFYDLLEGATSRPPLTTVALPNPDSVALLACTELIFQIQTLESGRPAKPPDHILLVPNLVLRASTRALAPKKELPEISLHPSPRKPDPAETWHNVYPYLRPHRSDHWVQLDLSGLANHSFKRHHGWLGAEPLDHFPPGLRSIHGVPFLVLDENRNDGRAVITFRSPHSHSGAKKFLPTHANIKVRSRVKALYFLHGCGYARAVPFAEYIIHFVTGPAAHLPLLPLGPSRQAALRQPVKPNLQDWWMTGMEQPDFPHAHKLIVFDPADPAAYQRCLYSLEWINPRPQDEITSIEVRVDPQAGPALALIAVTALL